MIRTRSLNVNPVLCCSSGYRKALTDSVVENSAVTNLYMQPERLYVIETITPFLYKRERKC
jgi:hypothetical protein